MKKRIVSFLLVVLSLLQLSGVTCFADDSFDYVWAYYDGVAQFEKDGKIGLLDEDGNILSPAEYDSIDVRSVNNLRMVTKDDSVGMLDEKGQLLQGKLFHEMLWFSKENGLLLFMEEEDGLAGLMDINGEIIHPGIWYDYEVHMEEINFTGEETLYSPVFWSVYSDDGIGVLNARGEWAAPYMRSDAYFELYANNWLRISLYKEETCRVGAVNENGTFIDPQWDDLEILGDSFLVCKGSKWGVLDATNTLIIDPVWDEIEMPGRYDEDHMFMVCEDAKWGFINQNCELISPPIWAEARDFVNGYAGVKTEDGKWGLIDTKGELTVSANWADIWYYANDRVAIKNEAGRWGVVDMSGNTVVDFTWDSIYPYFKRASVAEKDGKFGLIYDNEDVAFPLPYYNMKVGEVIEDSLYYVAADGAIGYADANGELLTPIAFKEGFLSNLHAWWSLVAEGVYEWVPGVYLDEAKGVAFINTEGEVMLEGPWESAEPFFDGYARVHLGTGRGVIDKEGTVVISTEYDSLFLETNHLFRVKKAGIEGWIGPDFQIISGIKQ